MKTAKTIVLSERGASLVEYALLVALIALIAVPSLHQLERNIDTSLNTAARMGASDGGGFGDDEDCDHCGY